MADVSMRILLEAVGGTAVTRIINDVSRSLGSGGLGGALLGISTAAAGVTIALGVDAVQAAGDFQAQTERLVTSAGELQKTLDDVVRPGLLKLSVDTATSTEQLSAGMYYVESAGFHAAAGLEVMRAAAEGAKSENADLDVVSRALTGVLVNYHMSADQASEAMNGLIAAVKGGDTNLQDLSSSMGAVLPIAASLHISFADVAGVLDTMTNHLVSPQRASQMLSHVLLALAAPSGVAVKAMKSVGLSAQEVKDAMVNQGLPEALQLIEDAVGKQFPEGSVAYDEAIKNITGGIMGFKEAAMLTGPNLADTEAHIKAITDAMNNGHGAVSGFAEVQDTFNFKMDRAKEAVNAFMIKLGTDLLPVLGHVVDFFTNNVGPTVDHLGDGFGHIRDFVEKLGQDFLIAFDDPKGQKIRALGKEALDLLGHLKDLAGWVWEHVKPGLEGLATAAGHLVSWLSDMEDHIAKVKEWFEKWKTPLITIATVLGIVLIPNIIKMGVEAYNSGAKITTGFVKSITTAGKEAWASEVNLYKWVFRMQESGSTATTAAGEVDTLVTSEQALTEALQAAATSLQSAAEQLQAAALQFKEVGGSAEAAAVQLDTLATAEDAVATSAKGASAIKDLALAEGAVVEKAAGAGAVSALATAEGEVVTKAAGSEAVSALAGAEGLVVEKADAGTVSAFATAEGDVGTKAAIASGEEGAAGVGGSGVLGLAGAIFGLIMIAPQAAQAMQDLGNKIDTAMGNVVMGSQADQQQMDAMAKWFADKHDTAGFDWYIQRLSDLGDMTDAQKQKLKELYAEEQGAQNQKDFVQHMKDIYDHAVAAGDSLQHLAQFMQNFFAAEQQAGASLGGKAPLSFARGGIVSHAGGEAVGPMEMLSRINDEGAPGELVRLPTGSMIFPHRQSVSMLRNMGGGGGAFVSNYHSVNVSINLSTMTAEPSEIRRACDLIEEELARRIRADVPGYSTAGVY